MVRKKKERKIGLTTNDTMSKAVAAVLEDGKKIRPAAKLFGIPHQTLQRYVEKKKNNPNLTQMAPKYDCRKVFSTDQEIDFAKYLVTRSKMAYGVSTNKFRSLAYETAVINNMTIPESWKTNKQAGKTWMHEFFQRNPRLSIRKPEACSLSRLTSFNKFNVDAFFVNLEKILTEKQFPASRIFNLDEFGLPTVRVPNKVIAEKGSKQLNQAVRKCDLTTF